MLGLLLAGGAIGAAIVWVAFPRGGGTSEAGTTATTMLDLRGSSHLVGTLAATDGGDLAYVGLDGNVYVVDPSDGATVRLSRDRSSAVDANGVFFSGIAWSRSGALAFTRTSSRSR